MIIWITGASKGIGKELAIKLAKEGNTVAVTARNVDQLELLSKQYTNIHIYPADVTNREQIENVVTNIIDQHGQIDLAILNAGGYNKGTKWFDQHYRLTINTNLFGTINCLEFVVQHMIQRKQGHIAVMGSVSGYGGLPNFGSDYICSKSALITLCESIYHQLKKKNIKLQLISPSFIDTTLLSKKTFAMPFLVSADKAAIFICRGLNKNKFEISFPKPIVWGLKLTNVFPYPLFFFTTKCIMFFIKKK